MKKLIIALLVSFMFSFSYAKENVEISSNLPLTIEKTVELEQTISEVSSKPDFTVTVKRVCVTWYYVDGTSEKDCHWKITIIL